MKKWKRKLLLDLIMLLILLFGVGALSYPFVGNAWMQYMDQRIIEQAQEKANHQDRKKISALQEKMNQENKRLALEGMNAGADPFSDAAEKNGAEKSPDYLAKHTIATISIPKINVSLPIFDRTSDYFLERGASLLEGTSYPIGGESSHAVISAHRGLSNAKFFTDLPELKKNDEFYIEIGGNTFAYKVIKRRVVEPEETEQLKIKKGKDLVTLLTCTPYMVNSHRLIVTGERTAFSEDKRQQLTALKQRQKRLIWIAALCGVGLLFGIVYVFWKRIKKHIIFNRYYRIFIPEIGDGPYILYTKKKKAVLADQKNAIEIHADKEGNLVYQPLRGGRYYLKNQAGKQYYLWVKKIYNDCFSYKTVNY
ncbi:class C sortase [Enterococcus florum]|uniref:Class C sortase n=1 Tax=Enterococcus florum TaxID=2480627 RepID=A0A4P5PG02_9ENTE|nr:class C sortase [Enterococcus florum]GCF95351.1 class C sortase [Enterococcus florum]